MFIPPNPNDRPTRNQQYSLWQLVILVTVICLWCAAASAAVRPDTSRPLQEFLRVLVFITGVPGGMFLLLLPWLYYGRSPRGDQ